MAAKRMLATAAAATAATLLLCAPAAGAATRFASPGGSGEACTEVTPCDIVTAINKSADKDDVSLEAGTYTPATALTDGAHTLTVHGQPGVPRPVIVASLTGGLVLAGPASSVSDVEIDAPAPTVYGLLLDGFGASAERVIVHALGSSSYACAAESTMTITDSVCVDDGTESFAFFIQSSGAAAPTLRNDTFEAPGGSGAGGGVAVGVYSNTGHTAAVTLINTIAHGAKTDLLARADGNALTVAKITAEYSNYLTDEKTTEGGKAIVTPHGSGTNQTAAPQFADPGIDDFHELAGSPTIGAGFSSPANGALDLDGSPRQFGGATDIGAYQFIPPPSCQPLAASTPFGQPVLLLLSCSDALGAPLSSYAIATGPLHGTLALDALTGAVTYTPAAGYAGADSFSFEASSIHGTGAPALATLAVGAPPIAPAGAPGIPGAPADSHPVLSPKRFAALARGASVIARAAKGTKITYTDTQAATTTFVVRRAAGRGVLVRGKCLKQKRRRALHGKRCRRFTTLGSFSHADVAGRNQLRFSGRVRGRALARGPYQLVSAPKNAAGKKGSTHVNAFTIVRR